MFDVIEKGELNVRLDAVHENQFAPDQFRKEHCILVPQIRNDDAVFFYFLEIGRRGQAGAHRHAVVRDIDQVIAAIKFGNARIFDTALLVRCFAVKNRLRPTLQNPAAAIEFGVAQRRIIVAFDGAVDQQHMFALADRGGIEHRL